MIPKTAIERAIAGGWYLPVFKHKEYVSDFDVSVLFRVVDTKTGATILGLRYEEIALDNTFWQALGKALGNKAEMRCNSPKCDTVQCEYGGYKNPRHMYDQLCCLIYTNQPTDAFWADLLK